MNTNFKAGIIAVDFKGSHVDIECLVSVSGILAIYPLIAIAVSKKLYPIVSIKETLDQASIMRVTIPNDAIDTELLNTLTVQADKPKYKDILFGDRKLTNDQREQIYELPEEADMYYCRTDGTCYGHPTIAIDVFDEVGGYYTEDIVGYRAYNDGMCKNIEF